MILVVPMKFETYLRLLSERLGEAHLPVNGGWRRATEIVHSDAIHYALVKKILVEIYRGNHCSNPADQITMETVLDSLGILKHDLSEQAQDREAIDLIERIGEISIALFCSAIASDDAYPPRPADDRPLRSHRPAEAGKALR